MKLNNIRKLENLGFKLVKGDLRAGYYMFTRTSSGDDGNLTYNVRFLNENDCLVVETYVYDDDLEEEYPMVLDVKHLSVLFDVLSDLEAEYYG